MSKDLSAVLLFSIVPEVGLHKDSGKLKQVKIGEKRNRLIYMFTDAGKLKKNLKAYH